MHKILIVEDEEAIREGLVDLLEIEGYAIEIAQDGEMAIEKLNAFKPHLVILDLMLPKSSGFEVCRFIRRHWPETFVLMLTAKNQEMSKIAGLEMGADDYVTKPFSVSELMARVKSMLRRVGQDRGPQEILEFGEFRFDFKKYVGMRGSENLDLSAKEFQILRYLSQHQGEVITREDLLQAIWGYSVENMPTTRVVDNHIVKLRQKMEPDIQNPVYIKSIRGVGYKFDPPKPT